MTTLLSRDPRPELGGSKLWERILSRAAWDAGAPDGLYGALLGLRCYGAALVRDRIGGLILSRGDITVADYFEWRATYLSPHRATLTALLKEG